MKIVHVINPYLKGDSNFQEITMRSMINARAYAKERGVTVEFLAMVHSEENLRLPSEFDRCQSFDRYVSDVETFTTPRKLPILKDILDGIQDDDESDYIIYSNIDIGVMPQFYTEIGHILGQGTDACIINRRRVSENLGSIERFEEIYSDTGKLHNGYDCFVFQKAMYKKFELGEVCIGIPEVGNTLAFNLMCFAKNFRLYTSKHLTFHIGYEIVQDWGDRQYLKFNRRQYLQVIKELKLNLKLKNMPGASYSFLKRHFKWLMNPTIHYPTFAKIDITNWKDIRYVQNPDNKKRGGLYEWLQKMVKLDN